MTQQIRRRLLKLLANAPQFRGRDRSISGLTDSFKTRPTAIDDGLQMYLDPYEWGQQDILIRGSTEILTTRLMKRLLASGDVFVDVGAHVGHHALVGAKAVGKSGRVIAIDPQPYNADRIGQNAICNGMPQIEVVIAAISDTNGFATLPFQDARDRSRFAIAGSPNDTAVKYECAVRRLDDLFEARGLENIELLKVDVEGFEPQVLRGLGKFLPRCRNVIFEQLPNSDGAAMAMLREADFELRDVEGNAIESLDALTESNVWARRNG